MEIKNKVAVITGGASGIGKAMAARFMQEGAAHVIIADVNPALDEVAAELGVTAIKTDVSKEPEVQHLIKTAE
ncbi:MAG: NAD(P)-dependent dehydrogenase (short-subunit alcohol dehydrogenase family), partial [Candidatus Azotimanducaceae bacterium]